MLSCDTPLPVSSLISSETSHTFESTSQGASYCSLVPGPLTKTYHHEIHCFAAFNYYYYRICPNHRHNLDIITCTWTHEVEGMFLPLSPPSSPTSGLVSPLLSLAIQTLLCCARSPHIDPRPPNGPTNRNCPKSRTAAMVPVNCCQCAPL